MKYQALSFLMNKYHDFSHLSTAASMINTLRIKHKLMEGLKEGLSQTQDSFKDHK